MALSYHKLQNIEIDLKKSFLLKVEN